MPHTGQCLCGEVKITISSTHDAQAKCHCTDCQHASGSAHSTDVMVKIDDVKFEGPVGEYSSTAASGNTVTRLFCKTCGSSLAHKSKIFGDEMPVRESSYTGNLPDFTEIPFVAELFVKRRWTGVPTVEGAKQLQTMS